jgi:hypothetical protein
MKKQESFSEEHPYINIHTTQLSIIFFIYLSTIDPLKIQHGCGYCHKIIIHLQ